jgi:type VI secretion system protein ImpF
VPELTTQERLKPSLLDRLTDLEPERERETPDGRVMSHERLRESVKRDLTWILITTNLAASRDLSRYPEVERSVLNFGAPDLAGKVVTSLDSAELARRLRQAIWDFEPRLLRHTVKVRVDKDSGEHRPNSLRYVIEADLWSQPVPIRLLLRTDLDFEDGVARIVEASAG